MICIFIVVLSTVGAFFSASLPFWWHSQGATSFVSYKGELFLSEKGAKTIERTRCESDSTHYMSVYPPPLLRGGVIYVDIVPVLSVNVFASIVCKGVSIL